MERKGGMDRVIQSLPLGRKHTVRAKLVQSAWLAFLIAAATCLPHLWQILRDYGLPALFAPAKSISEFAALPLAVTLSDLLLLWFLCRVAACLLMGTICLWLGHKLGAFLPAMFLSVTAYCLPCLLALSGMKHSMEYLGFYALFHAVSLFTVQGYTVAGNPRCDGWFVLFMTGTAILYIMFIGAVLVAEYEKNT